MKHDFDIKLKLNLSAKKKCFFYMIKITKMSSQIFSVYNWYLWYCVMNGTISYSMNCCNKSMMADKRYPTCLPDISIESLKDISYSKGIVYIDDFYISWLSEVLIDLTPLVLIKFDWLIDWCLMSTLAVFQLYRDIINWFD
jgi:hypothetical protein